MVKFSNQQFSTQMLTIHFMKHIYVYLGDAYFVTDEEISFCSKKLVDNRLFPR
jgi:hypothetical protein